MRTDLPTGIAADAHPRQSLIFLAQRLEELTSPRSLDSYKASTVNIPTLLEESIEQIEAIQQAGPGISQSSADCILDELSARVKGNAVASSLVGKSRNLATRVKGLTSTTALPTLRMLSQELAGWAYTTQVMHQLAKTLNEESKDRINFLASELVSSLVNVGMSRRHINEEITSFFWHESPDIRTTDDLKLFFRAVFPHYHDFTIYFRLTSLPANLKNVDFRSFNTKFASNLPENVSKSLPANDVFAAPSADYVSVSKIRAFDRYSAIETARKRVSLIQNLVRMYNHEINFHAKDTVLAEQCCSDAISVVRPELYSRRPVTDSAKPVAISNLKRLMSNSRFMTNNLYEKFISVCEFHGHSMDASSVENKLLNLWISLETISPSRTGRSKIDNVVGAVLPALTIKYLDRLVSSLLYDLQIWDRSAVRQLLYNINEENSLNENLIIALASPERREKLEKLLEIMSDQELLRNRTYKISKLLSSQKNIMEAINGHSQRVEWQIRRLYRARNQIVHLGKIPHFVSSLVDSAHDYFDQLLTTVVEASLGPNGFRDFDATFEYLGWEHEAYLDVIRSIDFADECSIQRLLWKKVKATYRYDVIDAPSNVVPH